MHDESGIAWDVETHDDGTRTLRVGCAPGRRYTIEQSADLAQWTPVHSWIGLASGQVVGTDIFSGPPPSATPPMQTQGVVTPGPPPPHGHRLRPARG